VTPILQPSRIRVTTNDPIFNTKVKVKLSLCFNLTPRHEDVLKGGGIAPCILTSALDTGEWLTSRPDRFTPRERAPGTQWIRGWVGPRAGLDSVV